MNWKESLRPTKRKIIVSLIITILWALFVISSQGLPRCASCLPNQSRGFTELSLIPHCCREYISLLDLIYEYSILFIIPFVISYVVISIIKRK